MKNRFFIIGLWCLRLMAPLPVFVSIYRYLEMLAHFRIEDYWERLFTPQPLLFHSVGWQNGLLNVLGQVANANLLMTGITANYLVWLELPKKSKRVFFLLAFAIIFVSGNDALATVWAYRNLNIGFPFPLFVFISGIVGLCLMAPAVFSPEMFGVDTGPVVKKHWRH